MAESTPSPGNTAPPRARRRYRPAVGPRLKPLLSVVFGLFALLGVNAAYLSAVRALEAATGNTYQNWFYLIMFLVHLVLGALFIVPAVVFVGVHARNTRNRPNRRAVRVGYGLALATILLLVSGVVLTRIEGVFVVRNPTTREVAFWIHVLTPLAAVWLFVLHRLAGKRINWAVGRRWAVACAVLVGVALVFQAQDPRKWNEVGPESGEQYFFPSLARTATGGFIPARALQNDQYCIECHAETHERWSHSAHRFSSFNNPAYLFSVRETRQVAFERDGDVQASRFCAGCHDPVVFFSGRFDDPDFDDVHDETAQAGITCTACHSITHLNSPRGNSDYTIEEPMHYPFAFSENPTLAWVNRQLVKSKPDLHKRTFLKPLHESAEFCGTCHKVHLPEELNKYKFLRGQNHYDSYLLSGVSGHGVQSFYYPEVAQENCSGCHMEALPSTDFGAQVLDESGELKVHDHLFPSANTAIPHLLDFPDWVIEEHRRFNDDKVHVDIFALRPGGTLDAEPLAPLRPEIPSLRSGERYGLDIVIRTLGLGHQLTQGTSDSNQLWLEVQVRSAGTTLGHSGLMDEDGVVDPWAHFVNTYMLDREGRRVDRRNAQDIFVPLYTHQIPPGAADVIHYSFELPPGVEGDVVVDARLRYRKFDTRYMRYVYGDDYQNDLPVLELASDRLVFPVDGVATTSDEPLRLPEWQRFNDYGIGLLRKGGKAQGELRHAEWAFERVEKLGRPDGPLNLARVYLAQGTVQDRAIEALQRASSFDPPAPDWSVAWFTGVVNSQNGALDEAIANFESIVAGDSEEMRRRGFDFSLDYRVLNELGQTLFERAKQERGDARREVREGFLTRALGRFEEALAIDPENVTAHYNLSLIHQQLGQPDVARHHLELYRKYKPDDNARDVAIATARRADPAANHAAEAIVIYDLQRTDAE